MHPHAGYPFLRQAPDWYTMGVDPSEPGERPPERTAAVESGTVWVLRLLDVADVVDLEAARTLTLARGGTRGAARIRGPEKGTGGVVVRAPPLAVDMDETALGGFRFRTSVRLFDFGVVSVRFAMDLPANIDPPTLAALAASLDALAGFDDCARNVWSRLSESIRGAVRSPHDSDVIEDYVLFEISRVRGCPRAKDALAVLDPARVLLGEPVRRVAEQVAQGYLARAVQYYDDDAAVIGWNAALVLDPDGSRDELEVLEIATARLLELRYYDRLLAREVAELYTAAEAARASATLFRSPFVQVARRAATLFVEVNDVYDRLEAAITLVGDAYTTRLYREAAERFRLDDHSNAVREKLGTLARVSEILQGEISHRRTLLLELAVVVLIVLELLLTVIRH